MNSFFGADSALRMENHLVPEQAVSRRRFLAATASLAVAATVAAPESAADQAPGKRWRVAIIGHTGQGNYGHGVDTMWLTIPEVEIVGVADPDEKGREAARRRVHDVPGFADYREMLRQVRPDIVAVAPRNISGHRDMILDSIQAGARGVYCEKPFCRTLAEADEIVAACQKSGAHMALGHRNRFHPALPIARQAVQDGAIGQLLEIRCRGKEDQRGGGLDLWVLGSHDFDLARYFAGNAVSCSAEIYQNGRLATPQDVVSGAEGVGQIVGDRIHARFEMEQGIPLYFDSIRKAGVKEANFGLQLIGNQGILDLRIDVEPLVHLLPGNPFQPVSQPRRWIPVTSAGIDQPEPIAGLSSLVGHHQLGAHSLIHAMQSQTPTECDAEDGRATVEMIQAVFASHAQGSARVSLPIEDRTWTLARWKA